MKTLLVILMLGSCLAGCKKKDDVELFQEGPIRINLTADPRRGYQPLNVSFSAYLETDDTVVAEKIEEIKWVIKGPNGFEREVIQGSYNYQHEQDNKQDFFHLDYYFRQAGKYRVQLILNKGQYNSKPFPVNVMAKPENY